jgi:hypothetical protein
MRITLTGATGFIGARLVGSLLADGHQLHLLGRRPRAGLSFSKWDALSEPLPPESLDRADAVIHLAGEPVAQRWSAGAKRRIRDTRAIGTRRLVEALAALTRRPGVLVCASAIGYYGDRGDELLTESSAPGSGFLPDVCREWEAAAMLAEPLGIRVVRLRIGVVLGRDGGALKRMLPPFRAGAGGRLASGRQWMSWIHVADLAGMVRFALATPSFSGAANATAPNPVRNADFTRALAAAVHRPAIFPVPALALKLLFGEMSAVLLSSQHVVPEAARAAGFRFQFPDLAPALANVLA